MSYVYSKVSELENTPKVGSRQCVALVQCYAGAPNTTRWKAGNSVMANTNILPGTAIATFIDGQYQNHKTGNHAALYISQDAGGIWVMDQWFSDTTKPTVSKRYIRRKGMRQDGSFADPDNNADAYSVIE